MYSERDGTLYAGHNGGSIWQIENPTAATPKTGLPFASHADVVNNDGARCNNAVVRIDFGDAPDNYRTILASDGARHSGSTACTSAPRSTRSVERRRPRTAPATT